MVYTARGSCGQIGRSDQSRKASGAHNGAALKRRTVQDCTDSKMPRCQPNGNTLPLRRVIALHSKTNRGLKSMTLTDRYSPASNAPGSPSKTAPVADAPKNDIASK